VAHYLKGGEVIVHQRQGILFAREVVQGNVESAIEALE